MFSMNFEIPGDVQVEVNGREVLVTGEGGKENRRTFKAKHVEIKKDDGQVSVFTNSTKKSDRSDVGTVMGHIKNMITGIEKGVTYKLKVVYSHFPMNIKAENGIFSVENFLGEKNPRKIKIVDGVNVQVKGQDIELTGINKEAVGLCASQIEQVCTVNRLDRRVFQDGIYIVEKNGKAVK
jgi:large subunit ribosomal protein L6